MSAHITYKLLFNEDPIHIPDPNKPENEPRLRAESQLKLENLKRFWDGQGKILFDRWQTEIRSGVFEIFRELDDCNCKTCSKLKNIKAKIELITEAQVILTEGETK